jgi:hypothetical protein
MWPHTCMKGWIQKVCECYQDKNMLIFNLVIECTPKAYS